MADPLTLAIATAVASGISGKAAEAMTEQARQAVAAIIAKLRAKLGVHPAELAIASDGSPDPVVLADVLEREFAADPGFRDEVKSLWVQVAPTVTGDAVSNVFTGQADRVIQMRDVHGDINL